MRTVRLRVGALLHERFEPLTQLFCLRRNRRFPRGQSFYLRAQGLHFLRLRAAGIQCLGQAFGKRELRGVILLTDADPRIRHHGERLLPFTAADLESHTVHPRNHPRT